MLENFWQWITQLSNSKIVALLIFFSAYIVILFYVLTGKERAKRLESYKYIPFDDDDENNVKPSTQENKGE